MNNSASLNPIFNILNLECTLSYIWCYTWFYPTEVTEYKVFKMWSSYKVGTNSTPLPTLAGRHPFTQHSHLRMGAGPVGFVEVKLPQGMRCWKKRCLFLALGVDHVAPVLERKGDFHTRLPSLSWGSPAVLRSHTPSPPSVVVEGNPGWAHITAKVQSWPVKEREIEHLTTKHALACWAVVLLDCHLSPPDPSPPHSLTHTNVPT